MKNREKGVLWSGGVLWLIFYNFFNTFIDSAEMLGDSPIQEDLELKCIYLSSIFVSGYFIIYYFIYIICNSFNKRWRSQKFYFHYKYKRFTRL